MGNIFENAKFGDRFKTRDGRLAIYNSSFDPYDWVNRKELDVEHHLFIDGEGEKVYLDKNNGMIETPIRADLDYRKGVDIVAKYTISEEELDKLAKEYINKSDYNNDTEEYRRICWIEEEAFKDGCRKAEEMWATYHRNISR